MRGGRFKWRHLVADGLAASTTEQPGQPWRAGQTEQTEQTGQTEQIGLTHVVWASSLFFCIAGFEPVFFGSRRMWSDTECVLPSCP